MKIGSLVFLSKKGIRSWKESKINPRDEIGSIVQIYIGDAFCYGVQWLAGSNGYLEGDLIEIENLKEIIGKVELGKVDPDLLRSLDNSF